VTAFYEIIKRSFSRLHEEAEMGVEIIENLKKAIFEYDSDAAAKWARKAVEEQMEPTTALAAATTAAIRRIGDRFGKGELFLPDLVGAADALAAATPVLNEAIAQTGTHIESLGTVIIGTVFGDIHTIGKSMVATLLTAEGFEVNDLGINVTAEQFLNGVKDHQPHILAMSALMTTTVPEQRKVIERLAEEGLRDKVRIMVGGGALTQEFADRIGADGYDPTAPGAVKLARQLLEN
jgi:corrinoid protein of di/trimethylamine methyltransferase